MNRSTVVLLVIAAVLAALTWQVTRVPDAPPMPRLEIPGYASAEALEAESRQTLMDAPIDIPLPFNGLKLEFPGTEPIELKRFETRGGATWRFTAPFDAPAEAFVVAQIVAPFKTPTYSREARPFSDADARRFGFDPTARARITATMNGVVWYGLDLYVGDTRHADGTRGAPDTWVMRAHDPTTVFAVHAKDLRRPLERGLRTLRDTRVFDIEASTVARVALVDADGREVVLTRETREHEVGTQERLDGPPAPPWSIAEPTGLKADAASADILAQVLGLRARTFTPLETTPPEAAQRLAATLWAITLTGTDGKELRARLTRLPNGRVIGRIDGRDEHFVLSPRSAIIASTHIAELRQRRVVEFHADDVVAIDAPMADGRLVARRTEGAWRVDGADWPVDPGPYIERLRNLTATRWARPDEAGSACTGIDAGSSTVTVTLAHGETWSLTLGAPFTEDEQTLRWARTDAGCFALTAFAAARLEAEAETFRERRVFAFPVAALARVTIDAARSGSATFVRDRLSGKLTPEPLRAGETPDEAALEAMQRALEGLEADAFPEPSAWDGREPGDEIRVTVTAVDGRTQALTIRPDTDGKAPLVRTTDGPLANRVFSASPFRIAALIRAREAFVPTTNGQ